MSELGQCIKSRDGAGGYNVLLYDGTLLCEGIEGREADDILAKLNELVRRANLYPRLVAMLKAMQEPGPVFGCSMCQQRDGCYPSCGIASILRDCEVTP